MTKKELILKAALKLFIDKGFEKTPTSLISKEAGVATGTLFHHFKNKEELIDTLYLEIKLSLLKRVEDSIDRTDKKKKKIHDLWLGFISWGLENQDEYRFMMQFMESAHISAGTREQAKAAFQPLNRFMESGLEKGIFYELPLELLLGLWSSHVIAACNYFIEHPSDWKDERFKEEVFASCWSTLAKGE